MKITKTVVAAGAAGMLGLAGLSLAVSTPLAAAATGAADSASERVGDRLQAIKDSLSGLVQDGTITQDQADKVAETLKDSRALRPHGPGAHHGLGPVDLGAAAKALGITEGKLHQALETDGRTLADVAQQQGVEKSTLVDALVAAGKDRIDRALAEGRLTRAQADAMVAALPQRVEAAVDGELRGGRGGGPGHDRSRDDGTPRGGPGTEPQRPSPSATTESSSLTA